MASSVVPNVRKKLRDRLRARASLATVQVTLGLPASPSDEYISLGNVDPHEQRVAAMAASHPREEEFVLHVTVSVVQTGDDDQEAATDRAYALAGEIENEIRNDGTINQSLGGSGWAEVVSLALEERGPTDGRRESLVHARVNCRARI